MVRGICFFRCKHEFPLVDHEFSKIISENELMRGNAYTHWKLLSEMEFGVWKYMFSNAVYALMGQTLLRIFPNKPLSSRQQQYDNSYIFQELVIS